MKDYYNISPDDFDSVKELKYLENDYPVLKYISVGKEHDGKRDVDCVISIDTNDWDLHYRPIIRIHCSRLTEVIHYCDELKKQQYERFWVLDNNNGNENFYCVVDGTIREIWEKEA